MGFRVLGLGFRVLGLRREARAYEGTWPPTSPFAPVRSSDRRVPCFEARSGKLSAAGLHGRRCQWSDRSCHGRRRPRCNGPIAKLEIIRRVENTRHQLALPRGQTEPPRSARCKQTKDGATCVAFLNRGHGSRMVQTFLLGFRETRVEEPRDAKARQLGVDEHHRVDEHQSLLEFVYLWPGSSVTLSPYNLILSGNHNKDP